MDEKRPIDKKRDSGGMADIGTKEDGAIVEMTKIGERLLIIKERSIYEYIMADNIDPNRTNIGLPNGIQKLLLNQGSESELVSRTFLTAQTLFKPEYINDKIDIISAQTLALNLLIEQITLEKEIQDLIKEEQKVSEEYERRRAEPSSYAIPSIVDLETRCKSIFQKADHVEQILIEIISIFYSKNGLTKQSHFPRFHEMLIEMYGEQDPFSEFIRGAVPFENHTIIEKWVRS